MYVYYMIVQASTMIVNKLQKKKAIYVQCKKGLVIYKNKDIIIVICVGVECSYL